MLEYGITEATDLDGVLEHGVVELPEGEAEALGDLGQRDGELAHHRLPGEGVCCLCRLQRDISGISAVQP